MVIYNFDKKLPTDKRINITIHVESENQFKEFLDKYNIQKTFTLKQKKTPKKLTDFDLFEIEFDESIKNDLYQTIEFQECDEQRELFERLHLDYGKFSIYLYLWNKPKKIEGKFITQGDIKHKYPIYIISKGRWDKCLTANYLELSGIDYKIVVEPSEYDDYIIKHHKSKIITLPSDFSKLEQGGIPARNFVLDYSKKNGDIRHWILDDNIRSFGRNHLSVKRYVEGEDIFRAVEEYTDRFKNVYISGHNYSMFSVACDSAKAPITFNTRVYSCILIKNDITDLTDADGSIRWRGKFNEDTDLSLRILKLGYPTFIMNALTCGKERTGTTKGGNTDTIYLGDDGTLKTQALIDVHPDVSKMVQKYGRNHHQVDYSNFKDNKFIKNEDYKPYINQMVFVESVSKVPKVPKVPKLVIPVAIQVSELDYKQMYLSLKKEYDNMKVILKTLI